VDENIYIPEIDYAGRDYKPTGGDLPPLCVGCEAYYKLLYEKGLTTTPFPPDCKKHVLSTLETIPDDFFSSSEERLEAYVAVDPVSWAKFELDWAPRWYQDRYLSCTSEKKIARWGRRCLRGDTSIKLYQGGSKPIREIEAGDVVVSRMPTGGATSGKVLMRWDNGIKEVQRIIVKYRDNRGATRRKSIFVTTNHPLLRKEPQFGINHFEWRSIEDGLGAGDKVLLLSDKWSATSVRNSLWRTGTIESVEYAETCQTWDLTISGHPNYVANDILVHNSGKCLGYEKSTTLKPVLVSSLVKLASDQKWK